MSDILDELGALVGNQVGDETFLNELSYYKSIEGVNVDSQIENTYTRKERIASNAMSNIKSNKSSVKRYTETIENEQERFDEASRQLRQEMVPNIRRAKSEYKKTMPLSKEAKQAKHKLDDLKRQFKNRNKQRRKVRDRIQEYKNKLAEKQQEIAESKQTYEEATTYMTKLASGVRKQFETANKMLAILDLVKTKQLDLNDPNLSPAAKSAIINFSNIAGKGLKISITEPLNQLGSADLMKAYEEVQKAIEQRDDIKKAVDGRVSKRIESRDKYVALLGKDPDLSQLESENSR